MKKRNGFTVMEVMMSITILTMVAAAIFPTVAWLLARSRNLAVENRAGWLLQEGMEIGYNVFLGNWDNKWVDFPEGSYHPAVSVAGGSDKWVLLPGVQHDLETRFDREVKVSKVCRNLESGEIVLPPCTPAAPLDERSKLVETGIYWLQAGKAKSVRASLLLTKLTP